MVHWRYKASNSCGKLACCVLAAECLRSLGGSGFEGSGVGSVSGIVLSGVGSGRVCWARPNTQG